MTGAIDDAPRHEFRERRALVGILRRWRAESVAAAVERDGRGLYTRTLGELPLGLQEPWLSGGVPDPVPIRVKHHIDEIRVVK